MIDIDLLLGFGAAYKKVAAGETIFQGGQACFFYHQLISGKIKAVNIDYKGKECLHTIVQPGESFGELPLFDDAPYAATAVSYEKSLIIRLRKCSFLELIKQNSDVHLAFTRMISRRLRFKLLIINSFASHCPEERIATILNYLKSEDKNSYSTCNQLNLTRQQIADMTGLRVETVIRTMRNMHNKGELLIAKGKVYCAEVIETIPT